MKIPFLSKFFSARASPQNSLNTMMNNFISSFTSLFVPSNSGKSVTELTAMQTSAVYACVRILSETIASLPLHTYTYTDKGKEKAYTHPLYYLLHDSPNPEMTSFVFREVVMNHLLLWGNAYIYIVRDGRGNVLELWPLLPDRMQVRRLNENSEIYYSYMTSSGMQNIRNDEIMHIPALGFDGIMGYSPIHIEEALVSHIKSNGIIKIYPLKLPQKATYPAVTYQKIAGTFEHSMGSDSGFAYTHKSKLTMQKYAYGTISRWDVTDTFFTDALLSGTPKYIIFDSGVEGAEQQILLAYFEKEEIKAVVSSPQDATVSFISANEQIT